MSRLVDGLVLTSLFLFGAGPSSSQESDDGISLSLMPYQFESRGGAVVDAERGEIAVPENRADPRSRRIRLGFVRFSAVTSHPGAPIVYLAGGPGGSGVEAARGPRFPLFMALREVADVIALDQRGTGWSNVIPLCDTQRTYPLDQPLTRTRAISFTLETAAICKKYWRDNGVDLAGYNTWESAADLDALREALGAEKVVLWGISYGTHLGLAALKRYPDRIERAVLASVEGLDETVKLPARTDAYFARVQGAVNSDERAAARYPDIAGLIRGVLKKLENEPASAMVTGEDGGRIELTIGQFEAQFLTGVAITDPQDLSLLLGLYETMSHDNFNPFGQFLYNLVRKDFGRYGRGMPDATDNASGISAERLGRVDEQAKTSILGDALNWPMPHLAGAYGVPDLGDDFRAGFLSEVPTLFLSGTLDGRTYPESAAETASMFRNGTHLLVENAGHNLFMVSPEVTDTIVSFLKGEKVADRRIRVPLPKFAGD